MTTTFAPEEGSVRNELTLFKALFAISILLGIGLLVLTLSLGYNVCTRPIREQCCAGPSPGAGPGAAPAPGLGPGPGLKLGKAGARGRGWGRNFLGWGRPRGRPSKMRKKVKNFIFETIFLVKFFSLGPTQIFLYETFLSYIFLCGTNY